MSLTSTLEPDSIWLQLQKHELAPLNPSLLGRIWELERAITRGVRAYPDLRRADFYDVELDDGWAYIHVHDDARTVYLVSYFSLASINSLPIATGFGNESRREC